MRIWIYLLLLLAAVITTIIMVTRRRATDDDDDAEQKEILRKIKNKNAKLAEEAGIPPEDLEKALNDEIKKEKKKQCNVSPLPNGICSPGYKLEKSCCYANDSKRNKMNEKLQLAKDIVIEISVGMAAGFILESMIKKGLRVAGAKGAAAGAKGAVAGAKGAAAGAKGAAAGAKAAKAAKGVIAAARAARAVSSAARAAATVSAKYAVAAAGGPIGLMVAMATLIFDAVSITLDILDVDGYDSFTAQGTIANMKNILDYSVASEFEKQGMDFPYIFPLTKVFPKEMETAQEHMNNQLSEKYLTSEMELPKNKKVKVAFDAYVEKIVENPDADPPVPDEFTDFITQLYRDKHVERDSIIYAKMKKLLGEKAYKIQYYKSISGPDRMGVSFSREGAKEWNTDNERIWLKNNDLFKPPDPTAVEEVDREAACYTDTYYVYDSGPADKPVMVPRKLPEKTVLANFYGPLLAYCEKMRQLKGSSTSVNPKALGTRFDFDSGVCQFSKEYCRRYGLEFKNNDCKLKPGQNVAEMIFGKTVTRATIREWDSRIDDLTSGDAGKAVGAWLKMGFDPTGLGTTAIKEAMKSYAKKSKPATKGPCPSGMRDDGVNCWLDPKYRGIGKPMGCKPGEEQKGLLCYPKCRDGYKSSLLECEGTCPSGSKNTGFTCLQSVKNNFHAWNYHRNHCYNKYDGQGYLNRGASTCNAPCLPGFRRRSSALGTGFCDKARGRYSRATDHRALSTCPDGHEKPRGSLLCYPKCKNKGDQGQYKYVSVLDWCQPEGGAGVKKGYDDRLTCNNGWERKGPLCYEPCKEGERDDGLFCKKAG